MIPIPAPLLPFLYFIGAIIVAAFIYKLCQWLEIDAKFLDMIRWVLVIALVIYLFLILFGTRI